jgi:C-terminal processing protease CtpA/Prc
VVVSTVPGSPAATAGIKKGDVIEAVNGVRVGGPLGGTPDEAAALLRGLVGSEVSVRLAGSAWGRDVPLKREVLTARPVTASVVAIKDVPVAVLRVPVFSKDTAAEVPQRPSPAPAASRPMLHLRHAPEEA